MSEAQWWLHWCLFRWSHNRNDALVAPITWHEEQEQGVGSHTQARSAAYHSRDKIGCTVTYRSHDIETTLRHKVWRRSSLLFLAGSCGSTCLGQRSVNIQYLDNSHWKDLFSLLPCKKMQVFSSKLYEMRSPWQKTLAWERKLTMWVWMATLHTS